MSRSVTACMAAWMAIATVGDAPAAEGPGLSPDLRLVYSFGGDEYTSTTSTTVTATESRDDRRWDTTDRFRIDLFGNGGSPLGFNGGVSLAGSVKEDSAAGTQLEQQSLSGRLNLGIAVAPVNRLQFEILPFAGYGVSELEYGFTPTIGRKRDSDEFFEYGLNVNAVFTTDIGIQFGGGVGFLVTESDYSFGIPGDRVDVRIEEEGPIYSIFIGTRL